MTDKLKIIEDKVVDLEQYTNTINIDKFKNNDEYKKEIHDSIVQKLQKINMCFLQNYIIEVNNLRIYPVEVESYYYNKTLFADISVHQNKFQRNKEYFGKLYFHRYKNSKKINFYHGGFDICFSLNDFKKDEEGYCLSILIRSAYINKKELICGINKLLRKIFNIPSKEKISEETKKQYENIEKEGILSKRDNNNFEFIHHQRISNNKYFEKYTKYKNNQIAKYNLNTIIYEELDNLKGSKDNYFYTGKIKDNLKKQKQS